MVVVLVLSTGAPSRLLSRADSISPICETGFALRWSKVFWSTSCHSEHRHHSDRSSFIKRILASLPAEGSGGRWRAEEVVNNQRDLTQAELKYARAINDYNRNLATLQRRTGLNALIACNAVSLSGTKPEFDPQPIPIEPVPLKTACPSVAADGPSVNQTELSLVQPLW